MYEYKYYDYIDEYTGIPVYDRQEVLDIFKDDFKYPCAQQLEFNFGDY